MPAAAQTQAVAYVDEDTYSVHYEAGDGQENSVIATNDGGYTFIITDDVAATLLYGGSGTDQLSADLGTEEVNQD
jgi:hypothetical protein